MSISDDSIVVRQTELGTSTLDENEPIQPMREKQSMCEEELMRKQETTREEEPMHEEEPMREEEPVHEAQTMHEEEPMHEEEQESVVVITYATHEQGYFRCLKESCDLFGYRLLVLGFGREWRGYGAKLQETLNAMRAMPPNQLVMFVDAFDAFMCGPPEDAVAAFRAAGSPKMVVGANRSMTTDGVHRKLFGENNMIPVRCTKSPYRFLCSGTYMCRARDGVDLLSSIRLTEQDDDQVLLVKLRNRHSDGVIALDCNFALFATLMPQSLGGRVRKDDKICIVDSSLSRFFGVRDASAAAGHASSSCDALQTAERTQKRIYSGVTHTMPVVVHGPAHCDLSPLIASMGFKERFIPTPSKFIVNKVVHHAKNVITQYSERIWLSAFSILLIALCILVMILAKRFQREQRKNEQKEEQQQSEEKRRNGK